jgi:hypothetical protein
LVFSGGCTIIADPKQAAVDYYVSKNILSKARQTRLQAFNASCNRPLAAVYFGSSPLTGLAQRLAMLHAD